MSTPSPGTAPAPKSPPSPPTNATTSPPPAASAPPLSPPPQAPPPATPTTPPPSPSTPPPSASPPLPETPSGTPPLPPVTPAKPPPSSGPSPSPPSTTPPPSPSPPSTTPPPPSHSSPAFPPHPHRSGKSPPAPRSGGGSPTTPPSPPSSESGISTGLVVGIAAGGVLILAALSLIFICCMRKRKSHHGPVDYYAPPGPKGDEYGNPPQRQQNSQPPRDHNAAIPPKPSPSPQWPPHYSSGSSSNYSGSTNPLIPPSPGMALTMSKSTFTYEELERATDGFSGANLLGQGGFGYVHRGVLTGGKYVAIKQLKDGSGQGDREFRAEVEIISRVHHKHLVSLIGYCITGSQRLLVYEFVQNNTLEFHVHGTGRPPLEWHTRLKIALGAARGLAYLHEDCQPKIIHRDIKSSNILLDVNFEAKVADFGLAKFTSDANTHVSTRVMGTFGYLAPEYASSGKLTDKSDVFSFGVMLLELITGRKPFDSKQTFMDDGLLEWARPILIPALEEGNFDILVDPKLGKDYDRNEMARMVACVAACVRHSAKHRPKMAQVVRALEGDVSLSDLNEEITPGLSTAYSSYGSGSSDYDTNQYNDDMRKFRKMVLGSQEYGSTGQYSNPTSEFGLNASGSSSEGQTTREMVSMPKKDSREVEA